MKNRKLIFHKKGFHILFFCLGLLMFSWPVLSIAGRKSTGVFFAYLFLVWIVIIMLLYLIGRHAELVDNQRDKQQKPSGADHV